MTHSKECIFRCNSITLSLDSKVINTDGSSGVECEIFLRRVYREGNRHGRDNERENTMGEREKQIDNATFPPAVVSSLFNLQIFEELGKPQV